MLWDLFRIFVAEFKKMVKSYFMTIQNLRLRITLIGLLFAAMIQAQGVIDLHSHLITSEFVSALGDEGIYRLAEVEIHPQYLKEYLAAAAEIQQKSLVEEPGVVCLFPTQTKEDSCQIRILEIYASQQAYQHHIKTAHFQKYKQGTLHMVKHLKLQDLQPLTPETVNKIFKRNMETKQQTFESLNSPWPKGEPNTGYAQYFIGNSYLADVGGGVMNVTFEPRCRNNWHIHHKQVQVLICVAGRGWYQEWGKEPVEMTPGTVIAIPAEAKHWHGAAKDSWFQHLTYHKDVHEGASNEWLEPVTDEIYNKLQ